MEASMHGTFDRSDNTGKTVNPNSGLRLVVIPALLGVALVTLAIMQPNASRWISEAAQAEFAATYPVPEDVPTRLAQPADNLRSARAN
jgi:uncharacterized membrane protein